MIVLATLASIWMLAIVLIVRAAGSPDVEAVLADQTPVTAPQHLAGSLTRAA